MARSGIPHRRVAGDTPDSGGAHPSGAPGGLRGDQRRGGGRIPVALEGDPRYYSRFGFEHSVRYGIHITLPSWAPPEAAQVLRLMHYDPAIRGTVVYPPAFDTLEERR